MNNVLKRISGILGLYMLFGIWSPVIWLATSMQQRGTSSFEWNWLRLMEHFVFLLACGASFISQFLLLKIKLDR